jgi:glycosyltransferase involved in cell wall biosynthesis
LLDAAARAPAVRFVVLGGSPAEVARWRALAGANVDFRGFVPNGALPAWFAAADVGVFPHSTADSLARSTSPLKLFDYAAAGLPVVASAIPALDGWVREGDNAFVCRPDDPGDLAAGVARALAQPDEAAARAARARAAIGSFTWRERALEILQRFAPELRG